MKAFVSMLVDPAQKAGMKVPPDPENYDKGEYVHFYVFEHCQLGQPMPYPGCDFDNAKLIAELSEDEVRGITYPELVDKGFAVGYSE